jgi:hypothetical protein
LKVAIRRKYRQLAARRKCGILRRHSAIWEKTGSRHVRRKHGTGAAHAPSQLLRSISSPILLRSSDSKANSALIRGTRRIFLTRLLSCTRFPIYSVGIRSNILYSATTKPIYALSVRTELRETRSNRLVSFSLSSA